MKSVQIPQIPKYPRLTHDEKRSTKLTLVQVTEIRSLFSIGYTYPKLSEMYDVAISTIKYWCDENYRSEKLKKDNERTRNNLKDPKFKAHFRKLQRESANQRRHDHQKIKKYHNTWVSITRHRRHEKIGQTLERRQRRNKDLAGFRQFWNRIESVSSFNRGVIGHFLVTQRMRANCRNQNLIGFRQFWNRIESVSSFQKCIIQDCKKYEYLTRGYCDYHYYHCYKKLQNDLVFFRQFWNRIEDYEKCSVIDCKKRGYLCRGFCSYHYYHCYQKMIKSGGNLSHG